MTQAKEQRLGFLLRMHPGNTHGSHVGPMPQDTRIALFLMGELVAVLRANDPGALRCLLSEGIQEFGVTGVE